MHDGEMILIAGAMLAMGLIASLVAGRIRLPSLLLFLGLGMAVGSDGTGWIPFDDFELARTIGIIALSLILFEGGLTAGLPEVRPVLRPAIGLALVGTFLTAGIAGLAAHVLFDLSLLEGLLVGAILSSTDGAAIFALLRGSTLRRRLARTLEGEAGFNDPVAVLLVLGFTEWILQPDYGVLDMTRLLVEQLALGAGVGIGLGLLAARGFRRARLATAGLYPVASVSVAALAFGAADVIGGSGFLAVYLAGLVLGGQVIPAKRTVTEFHQGVAWVAQIAMFFVLGLLVFPSRLLDVAVEGTLVAIVVVVVARPIATFVATAFDPFTARERLVLGWAGLRGAVPVVLATFPVIAGVPQADEFFDIAFFAVLMSTLLQGTTFEPFARALGVTTNEPALPRPLSEAGTIRRLGAEVLEFPVGPSDAIVGKRVRDLALPREALVNVIVRGQEAIPPRGSTRIEAGDRLHVLVREEVSDLLDDLQERWRQGPIGPAARQRWSPRSSPGVFSARPWRESDGDPAHPREIAGVPVVELVRTRRDVPGALLLLADGRYAVSGHVLAIGPRIAVQRYARERLRRARDDGEQVWCQEIIGVLATATGS